jgi:hypothetical protein
MENRQCKPHARRQMLKIYFFIYVIYFVFFAIYLVVNVLMLGYSLELLGKHVRAYRALFSIHSLPSSVALFEVSGGQEPPQFFKYF